MSIEKALLPGLWSLMDAGGYGSAKITYPCLLPLLSRLVDKVKLIVEGRMQGGKGREREGGMQGGKEREGGREGGM